MKKSTTLILLVLTLGLGAWLMLRDDRPASELNGQFLFDFSGHLLTKEEIRVDVDATLVAGIDLKSSAAEISLRKRPDGGWDLVKGITDRADESIVKELLDYCSKARIADTLPASEVKSGKVNPAGIGLDDAGAWRISWLKADGSVLTEIRAGKTAPLDNAGYVQVTGESRRPDVYLVNPDLRPLLARPLDSFRDPRVSRYKAEEVQRMVVRKGEGEVEFSRTFLPPAPAPPKAPDGKAEANKVEEPETTPWVISRPLPNAPADQPAVRDTVAMICGAKMKGWTQWTESAATGNPGDKPVVEVTLFPAGENAKGATLSFFTDPDSPDKTALCRDVQRKAAFKVEREIMDVLCLAESPNLFRSRMLAAVEPGIISTIQVTTPKDSVLVCRVGNRWSWRPQAGGKWSEAAPERLEKLIALINETEIIDFASDSLSDPAAYGLDKPMMSITMAAGAHLSLETLTEMTDKNSQTLRIGVLPDGRIFANFTGDPFVYRIGPELPSSIPQSFVKWRSLALTGFTVGQFRSLKLMVGTDPALMLKFNPATARWSAERDGADVSSQLDAAFVEEMVQKLGGLSVENWLENTGDADKALSTPAVTVQIEYETFGDKPAVVLTEKRTLELAPTPAAGAPFCYGRYSGVKEPFFISSALLRDLSRGLLRK